VIVRLMGEGQYRVDDSLGERLVELDERAAQAAEAGDEQALQEGLSELHRLVTESGERLPDDHLGASDLLIPPPDLTIGEARRLFEEEGLIPDLPG
jgi:hypothetical protein